MLPSRRFLPVLSVLARRTLAPMRLGSQSKKTSLPEGLTVPGWGCFLTAWSLGDKPWTLETRDTVVLAPSCSAPTRYSEVQTPPRLPPTPGKLKEKPHKARSWPGPADTLGWDLSLSWALSQGWGPLSRRNRVLQLEGKEYLDSSVGK